MPTRFRIYPYGASKSAFDLANALGGLVIKREGSHYVPRRSDVIINWGSATVPYNSDKRLNNPDAVHTAISKLRTYASLVRSGVPTLEFTRDLATAQAWATAGRVVGRDVDRGSGGAGITVYERGARIGQHAFYTKYIRKQREFRFHVYKGRVIRILEKLKKEGHVNRDKYIRSHLRGWVFASNHFAERPAPVQLGDMAVRAVAALGLDFGGVDIGFHDTTGGVVYEVNTAPGLEGTTIPSYANAILAEYR
jgi:hypothetical protein